jgi:hypothetical protein
VTNRLCNISCHRPRASSAFKTDNIGEKLIDHDWVNIFASLGKPIASVKTAFHEKNHGFRKNYMDDRVSSYSFNDKNQSVYGCY